MITRRELLVGGAALAACRVTPVRTQGPQLTHGVQVGDVASGRALVWARCAEPARMQIEWDTTERFSRPRRVQGPIVATGADLAAMVPITGLPDAQRVFVRVRFDREAARGTGAWAVASFQTPRADRFRVAWTGDTCGQGFGRNPEWGGLKGYAALRAAAPAFLLHSGDLIYADNPILPEQRLADGRVWRNISNERVARVCRDTRRFPRAVRVQPRGRSRPGARTRGADRCPVGRPRDAQQLVAGPAARRPPLPRARRHEARGVCAARAARVGAGARGADPSRRAVWAAARRVRARLSLVPHAERRWRRHRDARCRAGALVRRCGRVVAGALEADRVRPAARARDPRRHTQRALRGVRQHAGRAGGREVELASILGELKRRGVRDLVWVTADVHYAAAHHFDPARATATDFAPFWEFVAGPIHAGTFGPNELDPTFGPELKFQWAPPPGTGNLAPWDGLQSFGTIDITHDALAVALWGIDGKQRYAVELTPSR